jgi:hypothetical protein
MEEDFIFLVCLKLTEDEDIYVEGDGCREMSLKFNYYCWEDVNLDLADFEFKSHLIIFFVMLHKPSKRRFVVQTFQIITGELCFGMENKILNKNNKLEIRYKASKYDGLVTLEIKTISLLHFDLKSFISDDYPLYCCYLDGVFMGISMGEWQFIDTQDSCQNFIYGNNEIHFNKQLVSTKQSDDRFYIFKEKVKVEIYNVNVIPARLIFKEQLELSRQGRLIYPDVLTRRGLFFNKNLGFSTDFVRMLQNDTVRIMVGVSNEIISVQLKEKNN